MVSFQCQACGDTIKKPKLDIHRNRCHSGFDCLDCSTSFATPADYKSHTSCISEAEKYQKSMYKGKGKAKVDEAPRNNYPKLDPPASMGNGNGYGRKGWNQGRSRTTVTGANDTPLGTPLGGNTPVKVISPVSSPVLTPAPTIGQQNGKTHKKNKTKNKPDTIIMDPSTLSTQLNGVNIAHPIAPPPPILHTNGDVDESISKKEKKKRKRQEEADARLLAAVETDELSSKSHSKSKKRKAEAEVPVEATLGDGDEIKPKMSKRSKEAADPTDDLAAMDIDAAVDVTNSTKKDKKKKKKTQEQLEADTLIESLVATSKEDGTLSTTLTSIEKPDVDGKAAKKKKKKKSVIEVTT